ncbi:MAG: Murein DD-endopeptidase MepM and murein hydrolase activator NlpD, containing LysM domain [Modestobacter sp.]|nr:Murein DD-endopeptidase MepM and murein hydrolase activator NlpD, containing LysM domain [Modestobacter sp.]
MDPQRLARLLDGPPARFAGAGAVGVLAAVRRTSEPAETVEARGVLVTRSTALGVCRTVPVPRITDDGPAAESAAAPAAAAGHAAAGHSAPRDAVDAGQVVAEVAAGRRGDAGRRLSPAGRRRSLYVAAALLSVTGLGLVTSGPLSAHASRTSGAAGTTSVAEEIGLRRAADAALTEDEAAARLQEMVASRAEREDAQVAAQQVQADADQAAAQAAAEAARPQAVLPVAGARISSGFGYRWGTLHAGTDFAGPVGTPEYAVMDGVVIRAGAASGFGLAVYVQHANGDVTVYGHMEEVLVQEGQTVKAGDTIALLGNRGQSTGPHLHFEVHLGGMGGQKVDPLPWLREHGVAV